MRVTDDMIDSLVCPPPPSEPPAMSDEMINELIVPAPGWSKYYILWILFAIGIGIAIAIAIAIVGENWYTDIRYWKFWQIHPNTMT